METNLKNLKENIKKEFANAGLETEDFANIKNGICKEGLRIKMGTNIYPVIYFDTFTGLLESGKNIPEAVEIILSQIKTEKLTKIDFDKLLKDEDYVKEHIFIGLQPVSVDELVKKPFFLNGLEMFLYIRFPEIDGANTTAKINKRAVSAFNITEEVLWDLAFYNTRENVKLSNLFEELYNVSAPDAGEIPLYILTNKEKHFGAAAILSLEAVKKVAARTGTDKVYVIPSSIHEMLLMPWNEAFSIDEITGIIREVNATEVDEIEQLSDKPYVIDVTDIDNIRLF